MIDDQTYGFNKNDASELINLIGNRDAESGEWHPIPSESGSSAILFTTRTGGIAARSTSSPPHTFPSATVDLLDEVTGDYYSPNRTAVVYNSTSITVAHSSGRPRQGKLIGTRYFIDVDDCS